MDLTLTHWIAIGVGALGLIGVIIAFFTVPAFRTWVKTRGKEAFLRVLKEYVIDQAKVLVEKEYASIAAKVISGDLKDKESIKKELYRLGDKLKGQVKTHFGGDLKILGKNVDDILDSYIRMAADKVSPFPGRETAAALLEERVSDTLVNKGVEYVKESFLK